MKEIPSLPLTEFDIVTCGTYFQLAKAYIPFLPPESQKDYALLIRIVELMTTIEFYKNAKPEDYPHKIYNSQSEVLGEMQRFGSKQDSDILSLFSTLNTVNNLKKGPEDLMQSFLSKDQQELYEQYKNMLNI